MKFKHLFALLVLLSIPLCALQDTSDEDESEDAPSGVAYLNLVYDKGGSLAVDMTLPSQPRSWDSVAQALSQMLHCSPGNLQHPQMGSSVLKYFNNLPAGQRQQRIQQFEQQYELQLNGTCPSALIRNGLTFHGSLDSSRLLGELQAAEVKYLELQLILPKVPFVSVSGPAERNLGELNQLFANQATQSKLFSIPVAQGSPAPKLTVSFGWSRAVVLRTLLRALLFCLLPVCVLLRARAVSLRDFERDPTGAWFAYMKTLGWCTNGGMLLWYLTNLGGRQELQQILNMGLAAGPRLMAIINLAVLFVPAAFLYLACISISHRVFVDVKRAQYTWSQFLTEHSITLAQRMVPIACISAGIGFMKDETRFGFGLMFGAYLLAVILNRWKLKLTKNYPQIVTIGELRDRVFALAQKAGATLQQVVVLPAQRMQMANAFASAANTVTFTDFLLERMSKREVDAITGHELTHLKRSHPAKLTIALLAVIFAPFWMMMIFAATAGFSYGLLLTTGVRLSPTTLSAIYRWIGLLSDWGVGGLLAILFGFAGMYALSRRFERQADAGAVALTNDPEAMITALLKLSSLNLMPLSWGKGTGASLTHPSTLKRVQRIARQAQISQARLDELIGQFSIEKFSAGEIQQIAEQHREGEHYSTQLTHAEATHKVMHKMQNVLLILLALLVVPPALIQVLVERLHLAGPLRTFVYIFGILLTAAASFLAPKLLQLRGLVKQKAAQLQELLKEGFDLRQLETSIVGLGHGPAPRIYLGNYNFDTGLLLLSKERLVYIGRQLKFSLLRRQVQSIQTGPGAPSWWPQERIYLRWSDEASGNEGVFNLTSLEPCSASQLDSRMRDLYSKLLNWRVRGHTQQLPQTCEALPLPQIGEVTCKSPREAASLKNQFAILILAFGASWGVSSSLGLYPGYIWLTLLIVRVFETIPYLRYRDPKQEVKPHAVAAKAATATARA